MASVTRHSSLSDTNSFSAILRLSYVIATPVSTADLHACVFDNCLTLLFSFSHIRESVSGLQMAERRPCHARQRPAAAIGSARVFLGTRIQKPMSSHWFWIRAPEKTRVEGPEMARLSTLATPKMKSINNGYCTENL